MTFCNYHTLFLHSEKCTQPASHCVHCTILYKVRDIGMYNVDIGTPNLLVCRVGNSIFRSFERLTGSIRSFRSFSKIDESDSITVDLKNDWTGSNHSRRSFKKIDSDQIALVDLWKRANRSRRSLKISMGAICTFPRSNRTFYHKKRSIPSKNWWSNS